MVDEPPEKSGDGGGADEGKILSPHELDISDSEYVEEIDEGRYVVSPESRGGGNPQGGTQPQGGGQGHGGGRLSGGGGGADAGGSPASTASGGNSQRGPGRQSQSGPTRQHTQPQGGHQGNQLSEDVVRRWMRQKYQQSNSKYAFDVTAQFDGTVSQRRMASNDLITVFESLMLWYAQQVDSSMPVEEVLGILLMESNVPVRYPPESVKNLIKSTDLGPDDTIADLLEAVQDDDGVQL